MAAGVRRGRHAARTVYSSGIGRRIGRLITTPSAKTSGNFNGAALAGFRVERARLSIEGEFLWAGMTGSVDAPHFNLSLDTFGYRVMGGFRIAPALYIDGGVRRFAVKDDRLDPRLPAGDLETRDRGSPSSARPSVPGSAGSCVSLPRRTSALPATIQAEAARRQPLSSGVRSVTCRLAEVGAGRISKADGTISTNNMCTSRRR